MYGNSGYRGARQGAAAHIRGAPQPESEFSKQVRDALRRCFPNSCVWKNHGTEYSEAGLSDITGVVAGKPLAMEVKMEGGWFTPLQIDFLKRFARAGGLAVGIIRQAGSVHLVPVGAMGSKGNHHKELWVEIEWPKGLEQLAFWEVEG